MSIASLLATLALFAPAPAQFTVRQGYCPQMEATWSCAEPDGTIYLAEPLDGSDSTKLALAHELGHVWDAQHLNDRDRERYSRLIGVVGSWFWQTWPPPAGRVAPAEYFADAYAYCALGPQRNRWFRRRGLFYGTYNEVITRQVLAQTCWWLRHPPKH